MGLGKQTVNANRMKIKITATIEVDYDFFDFNDQEEREWFLSLLDNEAHVMLWDNDGGDEIGSTPKGGFEYEIITGK